MLTVRFEQLELAPGDQVLDAGAGFGRHAFEVARRGGRIVALDYADDEVRATRATFGAMIEAGEIPAQHLIGCLRGDATRLPFADGVFDRVITSEVLEHVQDDVTAIAELARVLRVGGTLACTVPSWWPEMINWKLSDEYHAKVVGGHVRIYSQTELESKLRAAGLSIIGSHHAHALHSPYWWLKCAVGPRRDDHPLVERYRKFLEWDIIRQPKSMKILDRALSPVLGKSLIIYSRKMPVPNRAEPEVAPSGSDRHERVSA